MTQKRLAILGATGSIGCSTLDLVRQHPDRFKVIALSANTQGNKLFEQCLEFRPEVVVMGDDKEAKTLQDRLNQKNINVEVLTGASELLTLVQLPHVDIVVSAIMGAAGLRSTLAAARAGKTILLANKESLVMTGNLLLQEAKKHGAILLPVDSEHNAIFQCMPPNYTCGVRPVGVRRILLTASGGPFFKLSSHDLDKVTPEEAINHPNWRMGKKISVDCATLMNKGLELIEACLLFSMTPD
ncbi:MAG TPA: 1-deoxy-D-xylulose-5-phosphate reductoisomerase, partial [Gammaproteobacteria bacterium]|nr:1-deoxy-D-xylulose-5-phosphate reductoisomerase [Gammaproteobacteria bacterium]